MAGPRVRLRPPEDRLRPAIHVFIIHVFIAPELQGEPPGTLLRSEGERYTKRAGTLRILLGGG
jgi:hypothetical protein